MLTNVRQNALLVAIYVLNRYTAGNYEALCRYSGTSTGTRTEQDTKAEKNMLNFHLLPI